MPSERPHPRRRPDVTGAELVGGVEKRDLVIEEYSAGWPGLFAEHRERIRAALGPRAGSVEHIGSTSVPGLGAKPIINILVTVPDITAAARQFDGHGVTWVAPVEYREQGGAWFGTVQDSVNLLARFDDGLRGFLSQVEIAQEV